MFDTDIDIEDPPWWAYVIILAGMAAAVAVTTILYGSAIAGTLATGVACATLALAGEALHRKGVESGNEAVLELLAWARPRPRHVLLAIGAVGVGLASRLTIGTLGGLLQPDTTMATHSVVQRTGPTVPELVGIALVVVVIGPAVEETVFRGVIQRYLSRWTGTLAAIGLVALTFGLLHIPQYGGFCQDLAPVAVPFAIITIDAVLYGALFARTGNVAVAFLAHGGANAVALVAWLT